MKIKLIILSAGLLVIVSIAVMLSLQDSEKDEIVNPINGDQKVYTASTGDVYPEREWAKKQPEDFGYSTDKLAGVRSYFKQIGGEALFVVKDGYEIISWGDTDKPIPNLSMRKSFLNSLLGVEYAKGNLDLDVSLKDLAIDDVEGLTEQEKTATIHNLSLIHI